MPPPALPSETAPFVVYADGSCLASKRRYRFEGEHG